MANLGREIEAGGRFGGRQLRWGSLADMDAAKKSYAPGGFDLMIAADVLYTDTTDSSLNHGSADKVQLYATCAACCVLPRVTPTTAHRLTRVTSDLHRW